MFVWAVHSFPTALDVADAPGIQCTHTYMQDLFNFRLHSGVNFNYKSDTSWLCIVGWNHKITKRKTGENYILGRAWQGERILQEGFAMHL